MTDRPEKYNGWTVNIEVIDINGEINVIEPPSIKKQQGWAYDEVAVYQWFNWLEQNTDQWIKYLDENITVLKQKVNKAPVFTMSTLPSASEEGKGSYIYVEEVDGGSLVFSDGQHWRKISDRNIVS